MSTVDRLEPEDHACLTFSEPEERLDLLAAFVRKGFHLGERVLCFTDTPVQDDLRQRGVPARETVLPVDELWGPGGTRTPRPWSAGSVRSGIKRPGGYASPST